MSLGFLFPTQPEKPEVGKIVMRSRAFVQADRDFLCDSRRQHSFGFLTSNRPVFA